MNLSAVIISAGQIIFSLGATVFFVLALYAAINDLQYSNKDNPEDELAHSRAAFKRSMLMVACGIGTFFVSRIFFNLPQMAASYGIMSIVFQSLIDAVFKTGLLLLFPFGIKIWRKASQRNSK